MFRIKGGTKQVITALCSTFDQEARVKLGHVVTSMSSEKDAKTALLWLLRQSPAAVREHQPATPSEPAPPAAAHNYPPSSPPYLPPYPPFLSRHLRVETCLPLLAPHVCLRAARPALAAARMLPLAARPALAGGPRAAHAPGVAWAAALRHVRDLRPLYSPPCRSSMIAAETKTLSAVQRLHRRRSIRVIAAIRWSRWPGLHACTCSRWCCLV